MIKLEYISTKNIVNPVAGDHIKGTGFFDWFSIPVEVAHLATIKEQSREIKDASYGSFVKECLCPSDWIGAFLFLNTSIRQYLPVLAMSTLTTSDLELLIRSNYTQLELNSIVTLSSYRPNS